MSDMAGFGQNNVHIQQQVQQQQVQQQQQIQHQQEVQKQETQETEFETLTYASRPSVLNKAIFKNDPYPGMNGRVGIGDIINIPAQAGKAAGTCGGLFMAIG